MIPHTTIAISEVKSKLLDELMGDVQINPRPILVTREGTTAEQGQTVAILLPPSLFVATVEDEPDLYEFQLLCLLQELESVERHYNDYLVRQAFIARLPKLTSKLWKSAPESIKRVCLSLDLAAKHLVLEQLTIEQIYALRHFVDLICEDEPNMTKLGVAKTNLSSVGLPPIMGGSQELVDLYFEEL